MKAADRSELLQVLQGRCDAIAHNWCRAIARTGDAPHSTAKVRQHLVGLTGEAIALLLTDPLERSRAEAIGASLARLYSIEPEVLSQTQELLAQQFVQGLPADQVVALQPRLAALLGGLAAGFFRQAHKAILAEQERIRGAPISDLHPTEGASQEAYEQLERRVQERTAELAVANEKLRREIAERRWVEEALKASESRFSSILSSMADLVFAFDSEGRFIFHHSPCIGDLFVPPHEFVGKKHSEVMPSHLQEPFAEAFEKNKKGEVAQYEYRLEIDGRVRWFSVKLSPVFPGDEFNGSVAVAREISELKRVEEVLRKAHGELERQVEKRTAELTIANEQLRREIEERKRAEEALRESEETARALLNTPTDAAALIDTRGIILDANETMAHRFRRRVDELIGSCVWNLFPSDVSERRRAHVNQVVQSSMSLRFEDRREGMWNDNVIYPVLDAQGKVTKVAVLARDITERKRTEEKLLRSQEEVLHNHHLLLALSQAAQAVQRARTPAEVYRTIGDQVTGQGYHAMIFDLADDREHVILCHTTFEPAWLQRVEELSGLTVLGFRFPLAPDGLFGQVVAEGKSVFCERTADLVARGVPELGRPLAEQLVAMLGIERSIYAPLRVSGEMHGLLGVASTGLTEADVPTVTVFANQAGIAVENAQLLEQVGASRERLRRLAQQIVSTQEEERQRMSRALHDEAGQVLTALKISLELIGGDLPGELGSLRQRIGDAAVLTDVTMEQIRSLAQDLRPPALDALGLNPTLEGFCRDFARRTGLLIDYLGLELPALPEVVNICLYRFLQEALTNVAKHACANQVCVALRCDAKTVSLSVQDDGRGFDTQARLFVSGWPMGIGLLGMQERLESLGGRLEVESRPGRGTRLAAHLPAGGIP